VKGNIVCGKNKLVMVQFNVGRKRNSILTKHPYPSFEFYSVHIDNVTLT